MKQYFHGSRRGSLDRELVRGRPVPRDEFVAGLVSQIDGSPARRRTGRVGVFVAAAGIALVALGISGGAGFGYSTTTIRKIESGIHLNQSTQIQRAVSPSRAQYAPATPPFKPPTKPATSKPKPKPKPPKQVESSTLPFTGLELWVPLAGGLVLLALGFGLRRGARRRS